MCQMIHTPQGDFGYKNYLFKYLYIHRIKNLFYKVNKLAYYISLSQSNCIVNSITLLAMLCLFDTPAVNSVIIVY